MPLPQKVDVKKALKARLAGQTYQQIADSQGVSDVAIIRNLKPILKELPNAEELAAMKQQLADQFASKAYAVVSSISSDDIVNASLRDKAVAAGVLTDKHRLITGQSTSNQAVLLQAIYDADEGGD